MFFQIQVQVSVFLSYLSFFNLYEYKTIPCLESVHQLYVLVQLQVMWLNNINIEDPISDYLDATISESESMRPNHICNKCAHTPANTEKPPEYRNRTT